MAEVESRDDGISVSIKRHEAAALAAVAEVGLDVEEALARIRRTVMAEHALTELRRSRGAISLRRHEAAALAAVAESAFALEASPLSLFIVAFNGIDMPAARRGLDLLKGALR